MPGAATTRQLTGVQTGRPAADSTGSGLAPSV